MKFKQIYILFIYFLSLEVFSIESKSYKYEDNEVKLLLIKKKQSFLSLGLDFKLGKEWKIYWKYPGDSGMPPNISFLDNSLKEKVIIKWPFPKELYEKDVDITTRVYENRIIFPIQVDIKNIKKSKIEKVKFKLDFQICKDICIPLSTILEIDIPKNNYYSEKNNTITKDFEKLVPTYLKLTDESRKVFLNINNKKIKISFDKNIFELKNQRGLKVKAFFHNDNLATLRLDKVIDRNENIYITFVGSENIKKKDINKSNSLVFLQINEKSYYLKQESIKFIKSKTSVLKISIIIIISFLGGIILNFMPCVLPVLGLKISNFLKQLELNDQRKVKISCLSLVLGIIFTFLLFGIFTTSLRILGKSVGWGMQFQNPIFLIVIIIILLLFIINLLGLLNIRIPYYISNFFNKSINIKENNIYLKNFFIGMFSTILATPCTAPFVGSAVSIALTQSYLITFLIFFIMAIGKAFPYIIFIFFPGIINFLPRPGKWLKHIKYFFAFLLFITLLWALNVLFHNNINSKNNESNWEEFNNSKLESYINNNTKVFVDVTAKWCITCSINKKLVLENKEIIELLDKNNIKKIRADWTLKDENILLYLKKYNRFGIPFNIFYSKEFPEGFIFNEILTKKQVKTVLNQVTND